MERRVGNQHARRSIDITRAERCAPSFLILFDLVGRSSVLAIRTLQISTNIRRIRLRVVLQLFHDNDVVVILAISDFDQAVVVGICISSSRYRFRSLGIVIGRKICIGLAVGPLLPVYCISGYIVFVMAEGNRTGFIGSSLIADSCAIRCSYNRLITSS